MNEMRTRMFARLYDYIFPCLYKKIQSKVLTWNKQFMIRNRKRSLELLKNFCHFSLVFWNFFLNQCGASNMNTVRTKRDLIVC